MSSIEEMMMLFSVAVLGLLACEPEPPKPLSEMTFDEQYEACRVGHDDHACELISDLFLKNRDPRDAISPLIGPCERGNFVLCGKAGLLLKKYGEEPFQLEQAQEFLKVACYAQHTEYCHPYGVVTHNLKGAWAGRDAYAEGCTLAGDRASCLEEATLLLSGPTGVQNRKRGVERMQYLCESGSPEACVLLAEDYEARGFPEHFDSAYTYMAAACDLDSITGCQHAGFWQIEHDANLAMTHYDKGCALGEVNACTSAFVVINTAEAVPRDTAKSLAYIKRACDLGLEKACESHQEELAKVERGEIPPPQAQP